MLHGRLNTVSFVHCVKPIPKWEKSLNALLQIGEEVKSRPADQDDLHQQHGQRLIWLLHYNKRYNIISIMPRLQKLIKKGTWTKGRSVSLKNFYENHETMEGLTEQDRRVCLSIVTENYFDSYYSDVEYRIDEDRALSALVGHPLVFLEGDLEHPVELLDGEPEIRFREEGGGTHIAIHPSPKTSERRVMLMSETPSRFKVIRFLPEHLKIAEILGEKGLKLPKKSNEMASRAVAALSSMITVNSDQALAVTAGKGDGGEIQRPMLILKWPQGEKIRVRS